MLLARIVRAAAAVAATRSRKAKITALSDCLRELAPAELRAGVAFLSGELTQGRIGLGPAAGREVSGPAEAAPAPQIELP